MTIVLSFLQRCIKSKDFRILYRTFFSPGPWPLRRPPETAILTSATSMGYQILAEDVSFYMIYCLLIQNKNWEVLDYVSQNGWIPPPHGYLTDKKPGSFRVKLNAKISSNFKKLKILLTFTIIFIFVFASTKVLFFAYFTNLLFEGFHFCSGVFNSRKYVGQQTAKSEKYLNYCC